MDQTNKSEVWKWFDKNATNNEFVTCSICKHRYKNSGNTTNMRDHLKRKHPEKWHSDSENEVCSSEKKRGSIKDYINREKHYMDGSLRKTTLDKLYVKMIAQDLEPYIKGEHQGFKAFVKALDNKYEIPSTTTLKYKLIPDYFKEIKNKLTNILQSVNYISLTSDMWTSISNEGILAITCHFIYQGGLMSPLLEVVQVVGHHDAENIAHVIDRILIEWGIREKIVAMVTDNASTMINVAEKLKIRHLPCFAHTLNLVVQDTFKIEEFDCLIRKCKRIVTFFRSSTLASDTLKSIQTQNHKPVLKLIQEVSTRWNSVYYMFKRLCEIKNELTIAISECPKAPPSLTAEDYIVLTEIITILKPFEVATEMISGEHYVTLSMIIPLIRGTSSKVAASEKNITTMLVKSVAECLKSSIVKRFTPYVHRTPTRISTLINPKFKKQGFKTDEDAEAAVQLLQKEYTSFLNAQVVHQPNLSVQEVPSTSASSKQTDPDDLLDFLKTSQGITPLCSSIIDVRQYLEKPIIDKESCPLKYWQTSTSDLKEIAWKYLCIPGSSVPSERIFSKAGQIMTERRNRLKAKRLNELLFLKQNIAFFDV